jgi:hypothetical protein
MTMITVQIWEKEWNGAGGILFPSERGIVNSSSSSLPPEICAQIKKFGYATSQKIRIYGEEFEVLSDPFPSDGGIAIEVRSQRTAQARLLQLPATVIGRVNKTPARAA